jgi:hypothetical protein
LPGHAFVSVAFPQVSKTEKIIASVGFSIALLAGLKALIETLEISPLFSELPIAIIVTILLLIAKVGKLRN